MDIIIDCARRGPNGECWGAQFYDTETIHTDVVKHPVSGADIKVIDLIAAADKDPALAKITGLDVKTNHPDYDGLTRMHALKGEAAKSGHAPTLAKLGIAANTGGK